MTKYVHDTLLINREAYFYLKDFRRVSKGFAPLTDEQKERMWKKEKYFLKDGLFRMDVDTFGIKLDIVKTMLDEAGFEYIDDGEKAEGFYL